MTVQINKDPKIASEQRTRSAATSAIFVMAASALSATLGFGREVVSAHYYGTRAEMDAFLNASTIPLILFGVFNGAIVNALVPTFSEYMSQGRSDEVRHLGSTVINCLFFAMSGLAILGWFAAPAFVPVFAHGFPPAEQQLVIQMVRWLMPGIVATSLNGVCAAILNAHHRFTASALVQVAANIVTISSVLVLYHSLGIFALVLGSVLGLFAQLLVQLPSIIKHRLYQFELDLRHPGLSKALGLLIPISIGSGATQINLAFDRYFASTLSPGSTAALNYVTKLSFLPVLVVSSAIATVIFPLIARQFASANNEGIRHSLSLALRMISLSVIPCAVGLSVLAYPIVQTLFQRGAFGSDATAVCASLVPFASFSLLAMSYNTILGRACYACKEVRLAVVGSFCAVGINVALSAMLLPVLGARGLLLANGAGGLFLISYLTLLLWRLIGGLDWRPFVMSTLRITLSAAVMGAALRWATSYPHAPADNFASRAIYLTTLLFIGATVFLASARLLQVEELSIAFQSVARRLSRKPIAEAGGNA